MIHIERFAPSPTGPLHIGHAFSAITAWNNAIKNDGEFLVRIEDIDQTRARPEWETQIFEDLAWLGLTWAKPVIRQSQRLTPYKTALISLWDRGLLYPCTCTRRDIEAATSAPQEGAPMHGPDGPIYPGTCRAELTGALPTDAALRLNMTKAIATLPMSKLTYQEMGPNSAEISIDVKQLPSTIGDVVLARKDFGTSYHLSVVIDDGFQAISNVTRGKDLVEATPIHVLLQHLLDLPTPTYHHHELIRDKNGKRLAKRDDAKAIAKFREQGFSPEDIYDMIGVSPKART